ncbi:MAG: hypothetical protein V8S08_10210 [Lachnoclostridium sp.]
MEDMDSTEDMVSAGEEEQPAEEATYLTIDTEEENGENDAAAGDSTDTGTKIRRQQAARQQVRVHLSTLRTTVRFYGRVHGISQ